MEENAMNNRFRSLMIVFGLLILASCVAPPKNEAQPESVTPIFVPVIITVEIPVPVTVTPVVVSSLPVQSPANIEINTISYLPNLEEDSKKWGIYTEGSPISILQNTESPSRSGKSLQCSITGGTPYSNVHCYQNFEPVSDANSFALSLDFQFTPVTTCNNQETPSIVQAIEFTINKWEQTKRYEFAVQWQNVGDGAPQWRYWDPSKAENERWVPINSDANYCLEGEKWHTLTLEGDIVNDQVHYKSFSIDNSTHSLDYTLLPATESNEPDRLAVAVQVDGNAEETPYNLFIDNVNFTIQNQNNIDCNSIDSKDEAEFNFVPIEFQQFNDPATGDSTNILIIEKNTKITWSPACLMDLQYYQNLEVIFDKKDASSGQYDFNGETLDGGKIPVGIDTEIKIWRSNEIIKSLWVRVKE